MTEVIISPHRLAGEPLLPPRGLLFPNPTDWQAFSQLKTAAAFKRHYFFNSTLQVGPDCFVAGPAVGAPMAVLALEKLIALGAEEVFVFGWCGSLSHVLGIGDLLLPSWCQSEEGTSVHYPIAGTATDQGDQELSRQLVARLKKAGYHYQQGPVWTTDAPYRETREAIKQHAAAGILGVEMEYAALCRVARFRGIALTGLFIVSDELYHTDWRSGYGSKAFRRQARALVSWLTTDMMSVPLNP